MQERKSAPKKERLNIVVHPQKVLIKITASDWEHLFSIWIRRNDGSKVQLFTDVPAEEGYSKRFEQNVSVGSVVAVGTKVAGILKGDIAIIDYLVTGNDDALVGYQNGHKLIAITAVTTYHTNDATPWPDGRRAWVKGDFDSISPLLGWVRLGKIIASRPYVFLKYEDNKKLKVSEEGTMYETVEKLVTREIIAAHPDSGYKDGDKVLIKEEDLFSRTIDKKEISVVMERDILMVK